MSKIEELGGSVFGCFDDVGICIMTCVCPCITWGQAMEDAGEGSCLVHAALVACIPCWLPLATSSNNETIDKKLGGQPPGFCSTCICFCCCSHCAICQTARAVKKGKEMGLLKPNGAPAVEEMAK